VATSCLITLDALDISVPRSEEKLAETVGAWHASSPLQVLSRRSLGERFVERENIRDIVDGWGTNGEVMAADRAHGRAGRTEAGAEVAGAGRLRFVKKPRLFPTRHHSA
jgi:hypothetical protein